MTRCPICGERPSGSLGAHVDIFHFWMDIIHGGDGYTMRVVCGCGEVFIFPSDELDAHLVAQGKMCDCLAKMDRRVAGVYYCGTGEDPGQF